MCGIAGILDTDGTSADECERLLVTLMHRGPDSVGVHHDGPAVLGQTRLAVIDLVTGDPPITAHDGAIGVALNGEIYNYREIRVRLAHGGHRLRTKGDTEVIAHLAEDLEPRALATELDGMFAFAVWDGRRRRLVLGRDRLGKKPLYYWYGSGRLVFGSELKALFADPAVPRRLDRSVLGPYLAAGYAPTPGTFFEGVRSVPPGHILVATPGAPPSLERYWRIPVVGIDAERLDIGFEEATLLVRAELEAAVERRLIADVPIGAFLSGGVDSAAVTALMARLSRQRINTFTMGFEDPHGFDERSPAARTAQALGTDHHEFVARPDVVDLVERLVWHHDQPFGDSSAIPMYLLAEQTRNHVTVVLSGDGGDEGFAGYERFSAAEMQQVVARLPRSLRMALRSLSRFRTENPKHPLRKVQRLLQAEQGDILDAYLGWMAYASAERRAALLGATNWSATSGSALGALRGVWDATAGAAVADRLLALNLETYLVDDLLPKSDRMTMAHGLELRSPLLDHHLLELTFRLPPAHRARRLQRKRVLRAAIADVVPDFVLRGPKRGFAVPLDRWFRTDLAPYVEAQLGKGARVRDYLVDHEVDRVLAEHAAGHHHGQLLWALLTLEVFLRREGW